MFSKNMNAKVKSKDILSLVRLPIAALGTIIYNIIGIFALQYFGSTFLTLSAIGYSIFATALLFRYSKRAQSWVLKSEADSEQFSKLLSFPLWLWAFIPSLTLILGLIGVFG